MTKLEKNWLEWVCFGISLVLVIGLLGYLLYTAVTTGKSPAHIELQLGPPQERGGKFFINVVAENRGEQTAEGVYVEVVLKANGKEERGMFVIDRLPRQGKRQGIVTFETDPRLASTVEARALGYAEP
jgi:uncharacterized protein (TIGR02588 family)